MNYSKQREIILNTLIDNVVHPSAEYIYSVLKKDFHSISLATVYRNLNKLAKAGKIKKIEGLSECDHFDHNTHEHYHFLCENCNKIFDIPMQVATEVKENVKNLGFELTYHELNFRGICPECRNTDSN